jgi:hypothetical protein
MSMETDDVAEHTCRRAASAATPARRNGYLNPPGMHRLAFEDTRPTIDWIGTHAGEQVMELSAVPVSKPADTNFIFGQSHFIKTVEDLHEALVGTVPGIRFGIAFCEASGKRLVRWSGTDEAMIDLACQNATAIAAGHTFLIFLGDGFFPSQRARRRTRRAGGMPHLLCHREPD